LAPPRSPALQGFGPRLPLRLGRRASAARARFQLSPPQTARHSHGNLVAEAQGGPRLSRGSRRPSPLLSSGACLARPAPVRTPQQNRAARPVRPTLQSTPLAPNVSESR